MSGGSEFHAWNTVVQFGIHIILNIKLNYIKLVEGVQRVLLYISMEHGELTLRSKIKRLGLMHLDRRRARSDILEAFKIINWHMTYRYIFYRAACNADAV